MDWGERVFDDFAGDVEYHPKRGLIYLSIGVGTLLIWLYYPQTQYSVIPVVFGLGSIPLLIKAVFFFRCSSEGLGLTTRELEQLSVSAKHRKLPPAVQLVARIVQDFGIGPLLLGFALYKLIKLGGPEQDYKDLLLYGRSAQPPIWTSPLAQAAVVGFFLVGIAWLVRHLTSPAGTPAPWAND